MQEETPAGMGARRYLKSREKPWAQRLAVKVDAWGLTPNAISVLSVAFALVSVVCLMTASEACCPTAATLLWIGAAVGIQMRLLCNLLDGMVAIEGGKKSVVGGLYNEVPDRIADPLILMAAGYSSDWIIKLWGMPLGWVAAVLAVMTAYIRVLGGTLTGNQSFAGPMAKQHRMAVITFACLGSIVELWVRPDGKADIVMTVALALIVVGCVFTCWRRLCIISRDLYKNTPTNP
ncbi:CDP-alcohol phosphatidyltransferase family protein [Verrucomicrobium sp. BvORR106]|uniref:CDP-alcohol phosphatidyltransferase family protein n=1 Tax=Verrucomicrobium sp. BvORR106 TaxID=1403819 RepID=UPI0005712F59|nr:CDP-alcohol phosphatidyltransferase family protein [Verrucomicrobium sp. BvORR106]